MLFYTLNIDTLTCIKLFCKLEFTFRNNPLHKFVVLTTKNYIWSIEYKSSGYCHNQVLWLCCKASGKSPRRLVLITGELIGLQWDPSHPPITVAVHPSTSEWIEGFEEISSHKKSAGPSALGLDKHWMLVFESIAESAPCSQQLMDAFHKQALSWAEYANSIWNAPVQYTRAGSEERKFSYRRSPDSIPALVVRTS